MPTYESENNPPRFLARRRDPVTGAIHHYDPRAEADARERIRHLVRQAVAGGGAWPQPRGGEAAIEAAFESLEGELAILRATYAAREG